MVDLESEIISYKETIAARGVKDCDLRPWLSDVLFG